MTFAPQHDYESYDAAVAKRMQMNCRLCCENKYQRYADISDTLIQARRHLGHSSEVRITRKREKIRSHVQLVAIFNALDKKSDGKSVSDSSA